MSRKDGDSPKTAVIAFTGRGMRLAGRIGEFLKSRGEECTVYIKSRHVQAPADGSVHLVEQSLGEWAARVIPRMDAVIFVGAAGIAVRTMAPFVKSKRTDPAVLVLDEAGSFCISLLSGHLGGANALALRVADAVGARPVITTATDVNGKLAVDVFAAKNHLWIADMGLAKEVSARILEGCRLKIRAGAGFRGSLAGMLPQELEEASGGESFCDLQILLPEGEILHLVPRNVTVGIGCRRGVPGETVERQVKKALLRAGIFPQAVCRAASIDLKKEEQGILDFCGKWGIPFVTYPAEELKNVPGSFTPSAFVKGVTGVDNVCERSAVLGSGTGRLLAKKYGEEGVTVACAVEDWSVEF